MLAGAVKPDLQYVPGNQAMAAYAAVKVGFSQWANRELWGTGDKSDQGMEATTKWVKSWAPGIEKWWNNTSMAEPAIDELSSSMPSIKQTDIYRSHLGDMQWQHGMTDGTMTAQGMQDMLVDQTAELIGTYRTNLYGNEINPEAAGRALGEALHYLQDTWTPSHAERDERGNLKAFYNYAEQGPGWHAGADVVRMWTPEPQKSIAVSADLMRLADSRDVTGDALRQRLREGFYPLAEKVQMGGAGDYGPRP